MRRSTRTLLALPLIASLWGPAAAAGDVRTLKLPDGLPLAYVDRGAGEPALVFVHCGNCRMEIWNETLEAFAPTHRVIAMDLAGHGRSGARRERWSLDALGADVAALVEHLGPKKVILVGNSLGGPVALDAARRLGTERVRGVVAVDTLHNVEAEWPEESWRRQLESYRQDFPKACTDLMLRLVPKSAPEAVKARIDRETCDNDPRAAIALLETFRSFDQAAALKAAGVPVKAINSGFIPTAVEVNRRHAASFDVIVMEGVGHYPQVERPEEFQTHLRGIVKGLSGG
jgi:pimeloyl-ACP methyl ester carboxylesterase